MTCLGEAKLLSEEVFLNIDFSTYYFSTPYRFIVLLDGDVFDSEDEIRRMKAFFDTYLYIQIDTHIHRHKLTSDITFRHATQV